MPTAGIIDAGAGRELRRAVLRPQLAPGQPLPGDDLPEAVHLGTVDDDGTVTCTCFVYPVACPWLPGRDAWRLRSMATHPQRRRAGLGVAVAEAAAAYAAAQGAQVLWCHARTTAVPFWRRVGYLGHGEIFDDGDPPAPHLRMWRELPGQTTSSSSSRRSAGAR